MTNKEIVIITGANGTIAKALSEKLKNDYNLRFLTRTPKNEQDFFWNLSKNEIDHSVFIGASHIIHLAGASIADKRWTEERKKEIVDSRLVSIQLLIEGLSHTKTVLQSFICASAIGFYGSRTTNAIFTENDPQGTDFLANVVASLEQKAQNLLDKNLTQRLVFIRTGIVLSPTGGALEKMLTPAQYGLGAALGTGKQFLPWIHVQDIIGVYTWALKNKEISGAYNACVPNHVTNLEFSKTLSKVLKKPFFLPNIPAFMMKFIFGELSVVLLEGSRVSSQKLVEKGFHFQFPELEDALGNLIQ